MTLLLLYACSSDPDAKDSPADTGGDTDTGPVDVLDTATIGAISDAADATLGTGYATGCSIAVWRDGAVVYTGGFGTKDEAGSPVTPDTLFQIGSDTKKMTAVTVLQLVDAGVLSLDDTLADVLPALDFASDPAYPSTLTLRQLLSHQSGLYDYTRWTDTPADDQLAAIAYGRFAENEYAMMPAGIAWDYSNPNFSLAGLVAETYGGGAAWPDLVIDGVARPLGMDHTYARRDDMLAAETDIASGYGQNFAGDLDSFDLLDSGPAASIGWTTPEDQDDDAFTRPAGLVWSTAADMARLEMFVADGDTDVVSASSLAELTGGQVALYPDLDPDAYGYGFGLMRLPGLTSSAGDYYGTQVYEHGGNTLDMTSTTVFLPELHVGVSILSNGAGDDMSAIVEAALLGAAADRLPTPTEPVSPLEPAATDTSVYAGSFVDHVLGDVTLSSEADGVHIAVPFLDGLGATYDDVLTPYALDIYFWTVEGYTFDLEFYPSADGVPASHAVDRSFVFNRVDDARRAPTTPTWSREELDAWLAAQASSPLVSGPLRVR